MIAWTTYKKNLVPLERINIILDDYNTGSFLTELKNLHPDVLDTPSINFKEFKFSEIESIKSFLYALAMNTDSNFHVEFSTGEKRIIEMLLAVKQMLPQTMILLYPERSLHTNIVKILLSILDSLLPFGAQLVIVTTTGNLTPDKVPFGFDEVDYQLLNLKKISNQGY